MLHATHVFWTNSNDMAYYWKKEKELCYNLSMIFKKIHRILSYVLALSLSSPILFVFRKNVQFMILCYSLEYYMVYPKKDRRENKNWEFLAIESSLFVVLFVFKVKIIYLNSHYEIDVQWATKWCCLRQSLYLCM